MNTLLIKELKKIKKNKSLISVYDNKDDISSFYIGYVIEIFSDSMLILSLDEFGQEDGYILSRLVDIFKIEKDSIYLNKASSIIRMTNIPDTKFKVLKKDDLLESGIDSIIAKCNREKKLISIQSIYMDCITGFIKEYDEDFISIETYQNTGENNGIAIIKYEDIQSLAFDRSEELSRLSLIKRSK